MKDKDMHIVKAGNVNTDTDYIAWLKDIKSRYHAAQVKAAVKVNGEKLLFNWQLGRDLVMRKAEERWGAGIVEQVALDLQREFPNDGFSAINLWYMKRWYLFYTKEQPFEKLYQVGKELHITDNQNIEKLHQVGALITEDVNIEENGLAFPEIFAFVPWRHHVEIISKCKNIDEALFYIQKTVEGGWSRSTLLDHIKANDFAKAGKVALNNFDATLPANFAHMAKEITKENYDFGFLTLPDNYHEKDLEDGLARYIEEFMLELGTGFAFVGRQKELVISGKTRRIDLLFYHIRLRSYVVVELKSIAFEPEFAGKLNFYVNAVNHLYKADDDNQTIGLLICRSKNQTEVQLSFEGMTAPLGVASYENVRLQEIAQQMPTPEQLDQHIQKIESQFCDNIKLRGE